MKGSRTLRYLGVFLTVITVVIGLFIYLMILPTPDGPYSEILKFALLSPFIWISIGVVNKYILQVFGSGLPNKLLQYTPKQNDVVVLRQETTWFLRVVIIVISIWGYSHIGWIGRFFYDWDPLNLTIMQGIFAFITIIPLLFNLYKMYLCLDLQMKNVPILVLTDDKLRTSDNEYLWEDIHKFNRPKKEVLEITIKEKLMEKYNTNHPRVEGVYQYEVSEDLSELQRKLKTYKLKAYKARKKNDSITIKTK